MKLHTLAAALFATGLTPVLAQADEVGDRIDRLEQEIKALKSQSQSNKTTTPPASAGATTTLSYGGYIKFDAQVSDYSDGGGSPGNDYLIPSSIPVTGEEGETNTHFNAKESRVWLKSKTATSAGVVNGHLEIDFEGGGNGNERVSNSYAPRIRQAYFTWDKWLFGQTWSTFFNVSALPDCLDFVGPVGTIFIRQAQLRYTTGAFQFALENPSSTLYPTNGTEYPYDDNSVPDLIARYNLGDANTNFSVAAMVRELAYDIDSGDDSEFGYAVSIAAKLAVGRTGDDLRLMLNQGNALGRYLGLNAFRAGVINAAGGIDLIDEWGVVVAYRHWWDEKWRSTLSLSAAGADNPDVAGPKVAKQYQTFHSNLIYTAAAELELGGELIYGDKELENGESGDVTRLQFSAKYMF